MSRYVAGRVKIVPRTSGACTMTQCVSGRKATSSAIQSNDRRYILFGYAHVSKHPWFAVLVYIALENKDDNRTGNAK